MKDKTMRISSINLTRAGFCLALTLVAASPVNSFAQEKGATMLLRPSAPNSGKPIDTVVPANSFAQEKGGTMLVRRSNPNDDKHLAAVAPVNSIARGQEKGATAILRLSSSSQREVQIAPLK